jgi:hypothetical protein
MRRAELNLTCRHCSEPVYMCDSVPDANSETGYRWVGLCWVHTIERRQVATNRINELVTCERQGLARVDRGRAGGDVVCHECGRLFYNHPQDIDHPYLRVLCDGSVVKL